MARRTKSVHELFMKMTDGVSRPLKMIGGKVATAVKKMSDSVVRRTKRMAGAFKAFGDRAFGLTGILGGLAAAMSGVAVKRMLDNVSARGDEFAKMAGQVGIASDKLQTLEFIANRQGASFQKVQGGIGTFSKRLGELRNNAGGLFSELNRTESGQAFAELLKNAKSSEEALNLVMKRMAETSDEAERSALGAAAFSKGNSQAFIRIIKDGIDNVAALDAEARRLRPPLSPDQLKMMEAYQDSVTNVNAAFGSLTDRLALKLAPWFQRANEFITEFVVANRDIIATKLDAYLKKASDFLSQIDWQGAWQGAKSIGTALAQIPWADMINFGIDAVNWIGNVAGELTALDSLLPALGAGVTLFMAGLSAPALALGAVVAGVIAQWDSIKARLEAIWEDTKALFNGDVGALGRIFGNIFGIVGDVIEGAASTINNLVKSIVPDDWLPHWAKVEGFFKGLWSAVDGVFRGNMTTAFGLIESMTPQPLKNLWNGLPDWFKSLSTDAVEVFLNPFLMLPRKINEIIQNLISAVPKRMRTAVGLDFDSDFNPNFDLGAITLPSGPTIDASVAEQPAGQSNRPAALRPPTEFAVAGSANRNAATQNQFAATRLASAPASPSTVPSAPQANLNDRITINAPQPTVVQAPAAPVKVEVRIDGKQISGEVTTNRGNLGASGAGQRYDS